MTQYLLSVHHVEGEPRPEDAEVQRMFRDVGAFNERMRDAGHWVFAGGLEDIDASTVVDGRGARPVITDGPFAEAKEWMGGFWVLELADLDEALDVAAEASVACGAPVEVRPFQAGG